MGWGATVRNWLADVLRVADQTPAAADDEIDRELHTLDHWRNKLSGLPRTIECRKIELLGKDHHEPYFVGPGRIEVRSATDMRFFVYAESPDVEAAFRKYIKASKHTYDPLEQFQVHATDYQGVKWACGWCAVNYFADANAGWPLAGQIMGLTTLATGPWVARRSSVELLLIPPVRLPTATSLVTVCRIGKDKVFSSQEPGQQLIEVLGTVVKFTYEQDGQALWITADTSEAFNHPFAENWLTEPLNILLGTPVYPRMVARNLGDGTAHVWLRPSPGTGKSSAIGLLQPFATESGRSEVFWQLYADILTIIAKDRQFEQHPLTQQYVELAQALEGSRWVVTLTLASTVESLASELMTEEDRRSEFDDELLSSMKKHLRSWQGDQRLRERLLNNLGLISRKSVLAFMRGLGTRGIVNPDHVQTWSQIRNSVMHGEMVEPWSSEDGDGKLHELLKLVHDLTRARIARSN
ncbi:hypothetical protein M1D34_31985 (plasmid) [Ensifer sp. D2-11]